MSDNNEKTAQLPQADDDMTSSRTIVFIGNHNENNEKEPKKKHHKMSVRKMLTRSRWMTALAVLANVLIVYDALLLTRYSSLSQDVFIKIDLIVLAILVALDLFAACALFYKKKTAR